MPICSPHHPLTPQHQASTNLLPLSLDLPFLDILNDSVHMKYPDRYFLIGDLKDGCFQINRKFTSEYAFSAVLVICDLSVCVKVP